MSKIKVSLGEINKAIRELDAFKKKLKIKTAEFVVKLAQSGVTIASAKIYDMKAISTGDLDSSITYMVSDDGQTGYVRIDNAHAAYVEFGTGIKGENSPHPTLPWAYDINNHGNSGWWYPSYDGDPNPTKRMAKDGTWWAWTKGMPSRPFMYETSQELSKSCGNIAKEVFNG